MLIDISANATLSNMLGNTKPRTGDICVRSPPKTKATKCSSSPKAQYRLLLLPWAWLA